MPHLLPWCTMLLLLITGNESAPETEPTQMFPENIRREHSIAEVPYIVYLEMDSLYHPEKKPYHAAGTIIDVNIVLTVAYHCEYARSYTMRVYPGQTYVRPKLKEHRVVEYLMHPKRKGRTANAVGKLDGLKLNLIYNHCLLRLDKPMELGRYVQKAPLPLPWQWADHDMTFLVSGWGPYEDMDYIQGQRARAVYKNDTETSLFFHLTSRAFQNRCVETLMRFKLDVPDYPFCTRFHRRNYRTTYGDDGGPVIDVASGLVYAIVATPGDRPKDFYWHMTAQIYEADEWINEIRKKWVPMAPKLK